MNVRLRIYGYCYSDLGAIYAKGLFAKVEGRFRTFSRQEVQNINTFLHLPMLFVVMREWKPTSNVKRTVHRFPK